MNIDADDFDYAAREYIKQRMEHQIGQYLQHQLKGVVQAELIKLRLTNPNMLPLDDALEVRIRTLVRQEMHGITPASPSTANG